MISPDRFIARLQSERIATPDEVEMIRDVLPEAHAIAEKLKAQMPSIGFASRQKRVLAFLAVCKHLDQIMSDEVANGIDRDHMRERGQVALLMLLFEDKAFRKAAVMVQLNRTRLAYDSISPCGHRLLDAMNELSPPPV